MIVVDFFFRKVSIDLDIDLEKSNINNMYLKCIF